MRNFFLKSIRSSRKRRLVRSIELFAKAKASPFQRWYLVRIPGQGLFELVSERGDRFVTGCFSLWEVSLVLRFIHWGYVKSEYDGNMVVLSLLNTDY